MGKVRIHYDGHDMERTATGGGARPGRAGRRPIRGVLSRTWGDAAARVRPGDGGRDPAEEQRDDPEGGTPRLPNMEEASSDPSIAEPPKRVLVVEDDFHTRDIYREMLEFGGYEVSLAFDGAEGVRLARAERPAVILLDISLPILSGWDAAEILKADRSTKRIPIIGISAHDAEANHERAAALGFYAYFAKPFPPTMVLAAVRRLFGGCES